MPTASTQPCITTRHVRVSFGGTMLADTTRAIKLRECSYLPRQYISDDDLWMDLLTANGSETRCSFKGGGAYFSFDQHTEVIWSHEQPATGMVVIARGVNDAFRPKAVMPGNAAGARILAILPNLNE